MSVTTHTYDGPDITVTAEVEHDQWSVLLEDAGHLGSCFWIHRPPAQVAAELRRIADWLEGIGAKPVQNVQGGRA